MIYIDDECNKLNDTHSTHFLNDHSELSSLLSHPQSWLYAPSLTKNLHGYLPPNKPLLRSNHEYVCEISQLSGLNSSYKVPLPHVCIYKQ